MLKPPAAATRRGGERFLLPRRQSVQSGWSVAHWCLTQPGLDGSRSANRPLIRWTQRNGSLKTKSNVTFYSTLDRKKKRKGETEN